MAPIESALEGTTLDQLQSEDQAHLFDVIDQLRSQGVGRLLGDQGLPQLIVCGDQNSGKSSLLQGLTRVQFPSKSKLCTTFATEIKLRRSSNTRLSTQIKAAPSRTEQDKQRLAEFGRSIASLDQLPALIENARECMRGTTGTSTNTFFDDVLRIEISGPSITPLTVVDLPGVIHFRNEYQTSEDVELVQKLVQGYMKQQNSIILAVISAENEPSLQIVLDYAQKIVPDGSRTLGIITKPDTLRPESEKEQQYLDLAQNNTLKFEHGWHAVRNRGYETRDSTNEERDNAETRFFDSSAWADLPSGIIGLGIDNLREKLGNILLNHILKSLPSIEKRLRSELVKSGAQLGKLGKSRETIEDQKAYLFAIGERFHDLTADALDGVYGRNPFFDDAFSSDAYERKLRAVVQNLNEKFAENMLLKGHRWQISDEDSTNEPGRSNVPSSVTDHTNPIESPETISRTRFLEDIVIPLAHNNRGRELNGTPNPLLFGSLFRQQSKPWEKIANLHLENVLVAVKNFLDLAVSNLTDDRTCGRLLAHLVDPIMESRRTDIMNKLQELLTPYTQYEPINIDPHFSRIIGAMQRQKATNEAVEAVKTQYGQNMKENMQFSVPLSTLTAELSLSEPDSNDKYGCSYAVDVMEAYYKVPITFVL